MNLSSSNRINGYRNLRTQVHQNIFYVQLWAVNTFNLRAFKSNSNLNVMHDLSNGLVIENYKDRRTFKFTQNELKQIKFNLLAALQKESRCRIKTEREFHVKT